MGVSTHWVVTKAWGASSIPATAQDLRARPEPALDSGGAQDPWFCSGWQSVAGGCCQTLRPWVSSLPLVSRVAAFYAPGQSVEWLPQNPVHSPDGVCRSAERVPFGAYPLVQETQRMVRREAKVRKRCGRTRSTQVIVRGVLLEVYPVHPREGYHSESRCEQQEQVNRKRVQSRARPLQVQPMGQADPDDLYPALTGAVKMSPRARVTLPTTQS